MSSKFRNVERCKLPQMAVYGSQPERCWNFDLMSQFQNVDHDVISRRKMSSI